MYQDLYVLDSLCCLSKKHQHEVVFNELSCFKMFAKNLGSFIILEFNTRSMFIMFLTPMDR